MGEAGRRAGAMTKVYVIASPMIFSGRGNLAHWDRFTWSTVRDDRHGIASSVALKYVVAGKCHWIPDHRAHGVMIRNDGKGMKHRLHSKSAFPGL